MSALTAVVIIASAETIIVTSAYATVTIATTICKGMKTTSTYMFNCAVEKYNDYEIPVQYNQSKQNLYDTLGELDTAAYKAICNAVNYSITSTRDYMMNKFNTNDTSLGKISFTVKMDDDFVIIKDVESIDSDLIELGDDEDYSIVPNDTPSDFSANSGYMSSYYNYLSSYFYSDISDVSVSVSDSDIDISDVSVSDSDIDISDVSVSDSDIDDIDNMIEKVISLLDDNENEYSDSFIGNMINSLNKPV